MSSSHTVTATKAARDQLAKLHLKFRQLGQSGLAAFADHRIVSALEKNPQGGKPIVGSKLWTVRVTPLLATYEIVGDEVRIVQYDEIP